MFEMGTGGAASLEPPGDNYSFKYRPLRSEPSTRTDDLCARRTWFLLCGYVEVVLLGAKETPQRGVSTDDAPVEQRCSRGNSGAGWGAEVTDASS